jgi:penicillin-binding protein 1A
MAEAVGKQPPVPFRVPPGIRMVRVDLKSGVASATGAVLEAFKVGTEPGSGYVAKGDGWGGLGPAGEGDPDNPGGTSTTDPSWGLY